MRRVFANVHVYEPRTASLTMVWAMTKALGNQKSNPCC